MARGEPGYPPVAAAGARSSFLARDNPTLVLWLLFVIACLNLLDRNILYVLQQPIKHDLNLTDTQLGAVGGLAFATIYCLAAFPIARLADRGNRTRIVGGSLIFWSVMTALSGGVAGFAQLVVCRMGVAAGEAGSVPASHSLISDYYPPEQRSGAFALWTLSQPLGVMAAYLGGGWLAYQLGWRGALIAVGVFGVALTPLALWLKEPPRRSFDSKVPTIAVPAPDVVKIFYGIRALRFLLVGSALHCVILIAVQSWSAGFYSRSFGMPIERVAFYLAVVIGIAGGLGTVAGGILVRRLSRWDRRVYLWIPACADILAIPIIAGQYLTNDRDLSLVLGFAGVFLLSLFQVSSLVVAQTLAPANMRATVTASLQFVINLTAVAIAPLLIGLLSDHIAITYGIGENSLRYAVTATLVLAPVAAFFFFRSAATLHEVEESAVLGKSR